MLKYNEISFHAESHWTKKANLPLSLSSQASANPNIWTSAPSLQSSYQKEEWSWSHRETHQTPQSHFPPLSCPAGEEFHVRYQRDNQYKAFKLAWWSRSLEHLSFHDPSQSECKLGTHCLQMTSYHTYSLW